MYIRTQAAWHPLHTNLQMKRCRIKALSDPSWPLQVMRKADLIRKNMVQSVRNERNILAMANNPFVVRPLLCRMLFVYLNVQHNAIYA